MKYKPLFAFKILFSGGKESGEYREGSVPWFARWQSSAGYVADFSVIHETELKWKRRSI